MQPERRQIVRRPLPGGLLVVTVGTPGKLPSEEPPGGSRRVIEAITDGPTPVVETLRRRALLVRAKAALGTETASTRARLATSGPINHSPTMPIPKGRPDRRYPSSMWSSRTAASPSSVVTCPCSHPSPSSSRKRRPGTLANR